MLISVSLDVRIEPLRTEGYDALRPFEFRRTVEVELSLDSLPQLDSSAPLSSAFAQRWCDIVSEPLQCLARDEIEHAYSHLPLDGWRITKVVVIPNFPSRDSLPNSQQCPHGVVVTVGDDGCAQPCSC